MEKVKKRCGNCAYGAEIKRGERRFCTETDNMLLCLKPSNARLLKKGRISMVNADECTCRDWKERESENA